MIRKSTNDLSIKPKMSTSALMTIIIGSVFVFIVGMYVAYYKGVNSGQGLSNDYQAQLSQMKEELLSVGEQLAQSKKSLVIAQRQQQIQEEAYKQINLAYANSEQKNSVLGSRLDFYRSIISPEDGQVGPSIQSLQHVFKEGKLSFDITLVQAIKHKYQVRGSMVVSLFNGSKAVSRWPENSPRSVNYQYFQQVSGFISVASLPEDAKIKVELQVKGGETLERWFDLSS